MRQKTLARYLGITFAITYSFWWGLAVLTHLKILDSTQGLFTLLHVLGGFGPTVAAIAVLPDRSLKSLGRFVFSFRKNSQWVLLLLCTVQALAIGLASMETNPAMPWPVLPIVMLSTTFLGGGNEELGWRGIMQPMLEKRFSVPVATLMTGSVWMLWHIPLWFVSGTTQQNMNFFLYSVYGLVLSFNLAAIRKKTDSIFFCAVFHGFVNLLMSFFLVKINGILVIGLLVSLAVSFWLTVDCRSTSPKRSNAGL